MSMDNETKGNQVYLLKKHMGLIRIRTFKDLKNKGYIKWQRNKS